MKDYYDTRAPEYDDWYLGLGRFASRERILNDGSAFHVYKRYFDGAELADELGGGTVVHESDWFVMVATGPTR